MARILGLDFAPAWIPVARRLQTLMVLGYTNMFFAPFIMIILFITSFFTEYFWISIGYGCWMVYDDVYRCTPSRGGRRWEWARHHIIWKFFTDYFPAKLIKTVDLPTDRNYLLAAHPHGILGFGSFVNLCPEASGFSKLFPGIKPHLMTLKANFYWPILRAWLLWMGVCDVSKESIKWILSKQGTGNATVVVVGGAEEALLSKPGEHRLKLKTRKGFVKIAVQTGASLVPVYTFGENDLYTQLDNPEGSLVRSLQERFKAQFGFTIPFFRGRGVFNYTFGLLPHRIPLYTVVGEPVHTKKNPHPSQGEIDEVHHRYIDALNRLFEEHKTKYGVESNTNLELE